MTTWLVWITWTSHSAVRKRPVNVTAHSLTHSLLLGGQWLYSAITQWGVDRTTFILQTTCSNSFSQMKITALQFKFNWSLFHRILLYNKSVLVQAMAWRRTCDNPLFDLFFLTHVWIQKTYLVLGHLLAQRWPISATVYMLDWHLKGSYRSYDMLTHLLLDKMAAVSQTTF